MILEWRTIGYPIEIYGLLVVAGTCLLYAFVLHVKMRNLARMNREQREQFKTGMERWAQEAESLRSEISAQPPLLSTACSKSDRSKLDTASSKSSPLSDTVAWHGTGERFLAAC